ncbi:MAG: acetate--CoA ligase family protein [Thermodesulfovibrionales bacterium]
MTDRELREYIEREAPVTEPGAKALLVRLGLSVPASFFAPAGTSLPRDLGLAYPLVAKVCSRAIASKTDAGGIRLGIRDRGGLERAFSELMSIKGAEGVLVEETAPPAGMEAIVGGVLDPQFGPVVMFGAGGLFVELYRDVAFALAPLDEAQALWLMRQVKGYRLIEGFRGRGPLDRDALARAVVAVSRIMETGKVQEANLNPVALYEKGALVLDAKLKPAQ